MPDDPTTIGSETQSSSSASGGEQTKEHGKPHLPVPRWLFNLFGHATAAILGLTLGYVILHALRPAVFPLPW
jgi:hypothetical protein